MDKATYIYALTDPVTEEVRYIGKTIYDPLDRLKSHIDGARAGERSYKNNWIRGLLLKGLEPDMSVLEIVFTPNDWQERERWWIAFAREQQCRLANLTDGGEGTAGFSPTLETRTKISVAKGKPYPPFINVWTGEDIPPGRNLARMCRERGLRQAGMDAVKRERQYSYNGWVVWERKY